MGTQHLHPVAPVCSEPPKPQAVFPAPVVVAIGRPVNSPSYHEDGVAAVVRYHHHVDVRVPPGVNDKGLTEIVRDGLCHAVTAAGNLRMAQNHTTISGVDIYTPSEGPAARVGMNGTFRV